MVQVLVRCSGTPGQKFVATSRTCRPFSTDCFGYLGDKIPVDRFNHIGPMFQDIIWTIQITAPPVLPPLSPLILPIAERACTPRRASYAADLRNPALVKAGFDPTNVYSYGIGYGGLSLNDTLDPPQAYFYGVSQGHKDCLAGCVPVFVEAHECKQLQITCTRPVLIQLGTLYRQPTTDPWGLTLVHHSLRLQQWLGDS
jgi:hypothetical protein